MSLQSKYFYKETIIKLSEMGLFTLHNCYVLYVHWTIAVQTLSLPIPEFSGSHSIILST